MADGVISEEGILLAYSIYPPLEKAPVHIMEKALSFEVHDACVDSDVVPCDKCSHLIRMAYQCYYGHLLSSGEIMKAIARDVSIEKDWS